MEQTSALAQRSGPDGHDITAGAFAHESTASPRDRRPARKGGRIAARLGVLVAAFAVMISALTGSANASSYGYGGYNSWNWWNCQITAGAVYDTAGSNGHFAIIGGGQLRNCSSRHNFRVFVQEQLNQNGNIYNIGSQVGGAEFYNSYGMSPTQIQTTGRLCGYYGTWRTAVNVWADGYWSGWLYSTWQGPVQGVC